jgi:hypothetical protein
MSYQYKGRGLLQTTGRNNMSSGLFSYNNTINLSPITLTGTGGGHGGSVISGSSHPWSIDFDPSSRGHELLKKYEVYESSENILALSVTAHRLFREFKTYNKITDRDIYSKVTPEDRVVADQIKDYYSKKVMMWKLKGNNQLSSFRNEMNTLIHSNMLTFKENVIGIAYWLPYFYEYDTAIDSVKSELTLNQDFEKLNQMGKPGKLKLTEELIPLKRLERKSKRSKSFEYWFKDTKYNAGVVIHLEEKNQLQHLWDTLFYKNEPMKIEGWFTRRHRDDFQYYAVDAWNLAQD